MRGVVALERRRTPAPSPLGAQAGGPTSAEAAARRAFGRGRPAGESTGASTPPPNSRRNGFQRRGTGAERLQPRRAAHARQGAGAIHRLVEAAELVDEAQPSAWAPVHTRPPAISRTRSARQAPSGGDPLDEAGVDAIHPGGEGGALGRGHRRAPCRARRRSRRRPSASARRSRTRPAPGPITNLPPKTPIEPVSVVGSATIAEACEAIQ